MRSTMRLLGIVATLVLTLGACAQPPAGGRGGGASDTPRSGPKIFNAAIRGLAITPYQKLNPRSNIPGEDALEHLVNTGLTVPAPDGNGRLAHAYLISGPPGSGKRGLVSDLSSLVTGTTSTDVFTSQPPGVYLAEPESKSRRIVTEQIRELEHSLQMRAAAGGRKVAIISGADRMKSLTATNTPSSFARTLCR